MKDPIKKPVMLRDNQRDRERHQNPRIDKMDDVDTKSQFHITLPFFKPNLDRSAMATAPSTPVHTNLSPSFLTDDSTAPYTPVPHVKKGSDSDRGDFFLNGYNSETNDWSPRTVQQYQRYQQRVQDDACMRQIHWQQFTAFYEQTIYSFCAHWKLNERAQSLLFSLNPEIVHEVIGSFAPKDVTRDVNAIFMAFTKSRASFSNQMKIHQNCVAISQQFPLWMPSDAFPMDYNYNFQLYMDGAHHSVPPSKSEIRPLDRYETFAKIWGLNADAIKLLRGLQPDEFKEITSYFHPKDLSRDINPVFFSFTKSRLINRDKKENKKI